MPADFRDFKGLAQGFKTVFCIKPPATPATARILSRGISQLLLATAFLFFRLGKKICLTPKQKIPAFCRDLGFVGVRGLTLLIQNGRY